MIDEWPAYGDPGPGHDPTGYAPCGCEVTVQVVRIVRHRTTCELRYPDQVLADLEQDWDDLNQPATD